MKIREFLLFLLVSTSSFIVIGQDDISGFAYSAQIKDLEGNFVANQTVPFRIAIYENGPEGEMIYSEIHESLTDEIGIAQIIIGEGGFKSSEFELIDWTQNNLFLKVEVDLNGNGSFREVGMTKLTAVPYAMYAIKSANGLTDGPQQIAGEKTFLSKVNALVEGNIILNNDAPEVPGAIRFNGTDFLGYDGEKWISLTAGGGAVDTTGVDDFICGELLIDERDGNTYTTVQIGNQCWMSQNLNFDSGEGSFAGIGNYSPEVSGRYYTWTGAMRLDARYNDEFFPTNVESAQGVCPTGWHVPSHSEFTTLENQDGVNGLSIQEGGEIGFNATLTGDRFPNGDYSNFGISAVYWSSSQVDNISSYKRIVFDGEQAIGVFVFEKDYGFSIRCVKD